MASWKSVKKEISRFIGQVEKRGVSSACVVGPHGSGKSTGMVAHIAKRVMDIEDTTLTYLLSTRLEATYMADLLGGHEKLGLHGYVIRGLPAPTTSRTEYTGENQCVCVASFDEVLGSFRQNSRLPFGRRAVVLVDLETNPTTDGEVLLGHLLEWARSCRDVEGSSCAVLTISPFRSQRAWDIMANVIGYSPIEITIAGDDVAVPVARVSADRMEHDVKKLMKLAEEDKGTRVFVAYHDDDDDSDDDDDDDSDESAAPGDYGQLVPQTVRGSYMLDGVKDAPGLVILPSVGFSLPVPRVGHFFSKADVEERVFDRGTSQIVWITRPKTRVEVLREQSWLVKSSVPVENTIFHASYDVSAVRPSDSEPAGEAYSADIMWTALSLADAWPSRPSGLLPVRTPPDVLAMTLAFDRLLLTGSIAKPAGPTVIGQATALGRRMLELKRLAANIRQLRYEEANLLASIPDCKDMSKNAQRVIVRLASVLVLGASAVCQRNDNVARRPSANEIRGVCDGVGARLAHKGAAWIALGVYQKLATRGSLTSLGVEPLLFDGPIVTNVAMMKVAHKLVKLFDEHFGLTPKREIRDTELTDEEILQVEDRLMRSYIYQTVAIGSAGELQLLDLASRVEFSAFELEITDYLRLRKVENAKTCFAVYNTLEYDNKYFVGGITTLPSHLFHNFRSEEGAHFTRAQRSYYPLGGTYPHITLYVEADELTQVLDPPQSSTAT
ncbi:uncharacterized protein F4807DRAFT_469342 [Annulohypoxylon truncatum]|uniref:uncharacterized protein n=1 Tax=Annulohypoxylon truncatum TaxID=327061 RepID=UPI0020072DF0|nr:uncharacterized protein F4807DRAFT_469342 [Annulohypoxylon truncatum]KAI1207554.1 hypothetical protein F4807DRAFT_469342 [Annulohypoxylon truncatum]